LQNITVSLQIQYSTTSLDLCSAAHFCTVTGSSNHVNKIEVIKERMSTAQMPFITSNK